MNNGVLFNKNNYPIVKMDVFTINTDLEYEKFKKDWLDLYNLNKEFEFEIETKNIRSINIKYMLSVPFFINELKKKNPQYLKCSKFYVYSPYMLYIIKTIFKLQSPIAPVYIIYNYDENFNNIKYTGFSKFFLNFIGNYENKTYIIYP